MLVIMFWVSGSGAEMSEGMLYGIVLGFIPMIHVAYAVLVYNIEQGARDVGGDGTWLGKEEQDCRQTRFAQRRYDNDKIVRYLVRVNFVGNDDGCRLGDKLKSFIPTSNGEPMFTNVAHVELLPVITKHSMVIQNRRMPKINPVHCYKTVLILYLGAMSLGMISCSEGKISMFLVSIHRRLVGKWFSNL